MRPHWARTVTKLHRSLTLTVAFLQRSPTKLKSQANSYWLLTNLARQSPAKGCSARSRRSENGGPVTTKSRPEGVMGKTTRRGAEQRMAKGVLADLAELEHGRSRLMFDPTRTQTP